jgi:hypothetical protein
MKRIVHSFLSIAAALALSNQGLEAATDYQVTGPILELTDSTIVVQKGKERWEIARDAGTKITGELKVGAKVTIHYTMSAKDIEVKSGKDAAADKPVKEKKGN